MISTTLRALTRQVAPALRPAFRTQTQTQTQAAFSTSAIRSVGKESDLRTSTFSFDQSLFGYKDSRD